jgi:hypothetical protein
MKKIVFWSFSIVWMIVIWRLTTTAQIVVSVNTQLQNILMMVAHFCFFGIQAILLYRATGSSNAGVGLTSLYGAIIEYRQLSVVGRTADPMDWVLDTLGALTFLLALKKLQSKV